MQTIKAIFICTLLVLSVSMEAQKSETRTLDSFDGISVATSVNAHLVRGSSNSVEISASGVDLEDVVTEIKGGTLKVKVDKKWNKWSGKRKVDVVITYAQELEFIGVSSSADITSEDVIKSDQLELSASSSGDMEVEIDVNYLRGSVSSSGDIDIEGSAGEAKITASSSGDFNGEDLTIGDADLKASSSGGIEVTVNGDLEASASSSGDIIYHGNPTSRDINKSSSGSVDKG